MDVINYSKIKNLETNQYYSDFLGVTSTNAPWAVGSYNSGTVGNASGEGNNLHPGIIYANSSTTLNSGGSARIYENGITLAGGEKAIHIIRTAAATFSNSRRRIGFSDVFTEVEATNGVYVNIANGVLTGKCTKSSVVSTTTSSYTLALATFYRLVISLNSDKTLATFILYQDNSNSVLWTDTLNTNIPTTGKVGNVDSMLSTDTTSKNLGYVDYIKIVLPNGRII